jgi:anti-sigma B factor antagonist
MMGEIHTYPPLSATQTFTFAPPPPLPACFGVQGAGYAGASLTQEATDLTTDSNNNDYLTVETAEDGAIVVSGDVDIAGGPILEAALLQRGNDDRLVIDLAGVSFMDSSGLRNLLAASRRAKQRGSDLVLRNVGPVVWRLLEITRTANQFAVESRLA